MLRIARNSLTRSSRSLRINNCVRPVLAARLQSSKLPSDPPKEVYTKLSDDKDPQRNPFFQYSWGSWMKNDAIERKRRETRFSIEGVTTLLGQLSAKENASISLPKKLDDGTTVLEHNLTKELLGDAKGTKLSIKSIASIHEGKHNRIYKVTLSTGKDLVLRIPYALEQQYSTSLVVKSEVATLDFLNLKLGTNVPKVVAYGYDRDNLLKSPFILMEHIEGDLLMKQWEPLCDGKLENEETKDKLNQVIRPIADFTEKLSSMTFNRFGSLYFFDDVTNPVDQAILPYDGETDSKLVNRWRIGPTTERIYHKNKSSLTKKHLAEHLGPWDKSEPLKLIESVAGVQLELLRHRLSLSEAGSSRVVEDNALLRKGIATFENLKTISTKLINPSSTSIMNVDELFKPRLFAPDLDPLNVIVSKDSKKPYFIDFENTSIKPFVLTSYPSFVAYQGAKIYDLEEDIPGFAEMDEVEQQQYQFMYFKTRNERLWEISLNEKRHDLIAIASPHLKVLKSPYLQAVDLKNDRDYLYVEGAIVQLQAMWDAYVANELVNTKVTEFPIQYTAEYLDQYQSELENYQMESVSTPFAATGGWVPQDMFSTLLEQGIIVEDGNGNFKIEAEKVLESTPEEERAQKEAEDNFRAQAEAAAKEAETK